MTFSNRFLAGGAVMAFTAAFATPAWAQCPGADGLEDNDTCDTALPVAPGLYTGLTAMMQADDDDWYSMPLQPGQTIFVDVFFSHAQADVDLALRDGTDCTTFLAGSASVSDDESASYTNTTGAVQLIGINVYVWSGSAGTCGDYDLDVATDIVDCGFPDFMEDSDTCATAASVIPGYYAGLNGQKQADDDDFYSIDLQPNETLDVLALFTDADGDLDLAVRNFDCSVTLDASTSVSDNEDVTYTNLSGVTETIVINVYLWSGDGGACNEYDLSIVVSGGAGSGCPNDDTLEDNDSCATALAIAPGSYPGLALFDTDEDYYSLTLADGDELAVDIFFIDAVADVDLYIYDAADPNCGDRSMGTFLVRGFSASDDESVVWGNTSGADQNLVIKVEWFSAGTAGTTCVDYDMDIAVQPCGAVADDSLEDNDDCANGVPVSIGLYEDLVAFFDDEDYYDITVQDGDTINVDIFFIDADGDLDLYLYNEGDASCGTTGGTWLTRGFSASDNETISWTNTTGAAANYVIWVDWWSTGILGCNAYDMLVTVGPSSGIGTYVCDGEPNSTGVGANIFATGSDVAASNNFVLNCDALPLQSNGYFINSTGIGYLTPPGSLGLICINQGDVGRYNRSGEVRNSGASGSVSLVTDLTDTPTPIGAVGIAAGETWYFQYWYRDSSGGTAVSNLSSALCVTFQ